MPSAEVPPSYLSPPRQPLPQQPDARPVEPHQLIESIPKSMRLGTPVTVEVRALRAELEAWSGGGVDPRAHQAQIITKAMAMRLKAPKGGFTIEAASPETQWSEGYGPLSDDIVSWRWIITPTDRGRRPLQLKVTIRVVGRDGLAAECALPEQLVAVRVKPAYGRVAGRLAVWFMIAAAGIALGYYGEGLLNMGRSLMALAPIR